MARFTRGNSWASKSGAPRRLLQVIRPSARTQAIATWAAQWLSWGYVTPWNNHGNVVDKTFGDKFSLVASVWLQVRPEGPLSNFAVKGTHEINPVLIRILKSKFPSLKIVPRIHFEGWTEQNYRDVVVPPCSDRFQNCRRLLAGRNRSGILEPGGFAMIFAAEYGRIFISKNINKNNCQKYFSKLELCRANRSGLQCEEQNPS